MNPCTESIGTPIGFLLRSRFGSISCDSSDSARQLLRRYASTEFNLVLWISFIVVTAHLVRRLVRLVRLWSLGSKLPGPPCTSFYGHCKLISRENLVDALSGMHEKYGSFFKLWLGPAQLLVSVKDPEIIREILLKAEDKLPSTARAFRLAFGRPSLFVSSFNEVHKRRESLTVELNTRLCKGESAIPARVVDSVLEKIRNVTAKGSINCEMLSQHMAFTILGATLFGDTFLGWSKASIYEELLMSISKESCLWASYKVTPFWRRGFWKYHRLCSELKCLTHEIIHLCRKQQLQYCHINPKSCADCTDDGLVVPASVGLVCSNSMSPDTFSAYECYDHFDPVEEMCANIMAVMFHGYLTTAALIRNVLARLATQSELQEQICSEIVAARVSSLEKDEKNLEDIILLTATIYESTRLLPPGPLLQRCSFDNDLHLKSGAIIPAGAVLVVPVQLVQMDSSCWGKDAAEFNPYRFLSSELKRSVSANFTGSAEEFESRKRSLILNDPNENGAFLPFGFGIRACVGQRYIMRCLVSLFALLLENYEVRLQPRDQADLQPSCNSCVLQVHPSPEVGLVKRSN